MGRRLEQLPNSFAVDESATVENGDCIGDRSQLCTLTRHLRVDNAVADDTYAPVRAGAIVANQVTLIIGERDDSIGSLDQIGLDVPLRQTFRRTLAKLVFRAIKRMNGVNDGYTGETANGNCDQLGPGGPGSASTRRGAPPRPG